MAAESSSGARLALLIDGENFPAKLAAPLVEKARGLGAIVTARVYGAAPKIKEWQIAIAGHRLVPVVVEKRRGRDDVDFRLMIEAMDLLHNSGLDGFCIASSDGDFAPLAERIRATAHALYLFGEKKTPDGYRKIAHEFFEIAQVAAPVALAGRKPAATVAARGGARRKPSAPAKPVSDKSADLVARIHAAIRSAADEHGWASFATINNKLRSADRAFTVSAHATNMKQLLKATPGVSIETRGGIPMASLTDR